MKIDYFLDGIQILRKYYHDPNGYHIGAEHDKVYVYATDIPVNPEDLKKLCDLGWFQEIDGDDEDEYSPEKYDQDESWATFM